MKLLTVDKFRFIEIDGRRISKEIIIEIRRVQKHNILKKEPLGILEILEIRIPIELKDIS